VGFIERLTSLFKYQPRSGFDPAQFLQSPWANGHGLDPIIFPAPNGGIITAADAMRVPPVARAVLLYSTVMGSLTLRNRDGGDADHWMTHSETAETPAHRWAGVMQDLMFYRDSVVFVARDGDGKILDGIKLPRNLWSLTDDGEVAINGQRWADQSETLYFRSLLPMGFLEYGAEAVEHYHDLGNTIRSRARNPIPLVELHITEDYEPPIGDNGEELKKTQEDWATARQAINGATAITPRGIQMIAHQPNNSDSEMLLGARNAVRLDVANFMNINASMLDGNNGSSMDYSNTLQKANEFTSLSMSTWTIPIEARLSQDDVSAPGTSVTFGVNTFDSTTSTNTPTNPATLNQTSKELSQ